MPHSAKSEARNPKQIRITKMPMTKAISCAAMSRRELLRSSGLGLGSLALTWMLAEQRGRGQDQPHDLRPRAAHFPGRARAVTLLMQNGGPSQMDLFDPKPALTRLDGPGTGGNAGQCHRVR